MQHISDLEAWGAVAVLYLWSLFMFFIAPVWIGLILLVIAVVMTFVVIGQVRSRRHDELLEAVRQS
jgi:uncharacterized membrane protein